ncbi:hypothetical protein EIB38_23600, partial [Salmonella enterica subsp. enterica serovar Typhimurium]
KGVLITGLKLKAFRNPQPSWGFSIDKKNRSHGAPVCFSTPCSLQRVLDVTAARHRRGTSL